MERLAATRRWVSVATVTTALLITGCTASGSPTSPTRSATQSPSRSGTTAPVTSCLATRQAIRHSQGIPEVHGAGTASLYGLLMPLHLPVRVGDQLKIVWRMTGKGPIRLWATSPTGRRLSLAWGPDLHLSSNYDRPGQEWGAGYQFPTAGCWRLHARRTVGRAVVALPVVAR